MPARSATMLLCAAMLALPAAAGTQGSPISEARLIGRRDIIYFEDFESNRHGGTVTEDPRLVKIGRRSLKVMYKKGGHGVDGRPKRSPTWSQKLEQVFIRRYIMFEPGFDFAAGGKIDGSVCFAPGKKWVAGFGGKPSHGNDGFSCRLCWSSRGKIDMYTYHADMKGKYGSGFRVNSSFKPGVWQCIELQIKINTITPGAAKGNNDGEVRCWVDGVQQGEQTGLRFRDLPTMGIDNWSYGFYFGGTWTSPKDQHIFMDNVVVAHNYIGPAVLRRPKAKAKKAVVFKPKERHDPLKPFADALAPVRAKAKAGDFAAAMAGCDEIVKASAGKEGADILAAYRAGLAAGGELKKLVIAGAAKKKPTVYVDFGGRAMRMKLIKADEAGGEFQMRGTAMPIRWRQVSPRRFYGIAAKFSPDTARGHLMLGSYCAALGLADEARAELDKAAAEAELHEETERCRALIP